MSNELKMSLGIAFANGGLTDTVALTTTFINQNAIGFQGDVILVSASAEQDLVSTNITTLGMLYLKNLDTTNYVTWGPNNGGSMVPIGRLAPGESAVLRLEPSVTLRWIANTADVLVLAKLYND